MWDLRIHQPATIQIVGSSGSGNIFTLLDILYNSKFYLYFQVKRL